jgi:RimJ/RimL family protein N-acetyltransferase
MTPSDLSSAHPRPALRGRQASKSSAAEDGDRSRDDAIVLERLETERLVLRPIELADLDVLVELDADPEVMRFLSARPSTRAEVEASLQKPRGRRWVATERNADEFVGWFGLVPSRDDTYEIGYRLGQRWWGRGFATEGARAVIDAAFRALGARRVTAQTMAVNRRSRRVMQRCGMRYVRTFHAEFDEALPGTEHGEVEYELTLDRWSPRRS